MTMLMLSVKMETKGQKSSSGHQQQNTRLCADKIPVGRAGVGKTTSKAREVQIPSNLEGRRDYHTEATSVVTKKGHVKTAPGSRSLHSREAVVYLKLWIALSSLARFFFGDYFDIQIVEIVY